MCIALITPTGGRLAQFKLCQLFMQRQTYAGKVLWVIVDDCWPTTTDVVSEEFKENWVIRKIYPKPVWKAGMNTQGRNIEAGMNIVKQYDVEAIFIIEDDDYYRSVYLESMMSRFQNFDVIGERNTVYYNVYFRGFVTNDNIKHASLFQVAFTPKALPIFELCYAQKFIDFVFFSMAKNVNLFNAGNLAIGIKGIKGRPGIGAGHVKTMYTRQDRLDLSMNWLNAQIGDDSKLYADFYNVTQLQAHASFQKRRL
jgi:hypothetical protein